MSAFRATDSYAVEAYRLSGGFEGSGRSLGEQIRRTAVSCGGALVAASAGGLDERRELERARVALLESRYYLYRARRFGLIDRRRYRLLTLRQDAAMKELGALLEERTRERSTPLQGPRPP